MPKNRVAAGVLAVGVFASSGSLVACDNEDRKDIQEEVGNVQENVDKSVDKVEEGIDKADSDGHDN